jgi:hypothetical protein
MDSFDQEMEQTYYDLNNLIGEWQEEDVKGESPEYEPFSSDEQAELQRQELRQEQPEPSQEHAEPIQAEPATDKPSFKGKSCGKSSGKGEGKRQTALGKSSGKGGGKSSGKGGGKGKSSGSGKGKKGKARQFWVKGSGRRMLGGTPLSSSKGCRLSRTQRRLESGVHLNWLERESASFVPDEEP